MRQACNGYSYKKASLFSPVETFMPQQGPSAGSKTTFMILTVSKNRAVPVHFKVADGNTRDIPLIPRSATDKNLNHIHNYG
jgi:hypothetical protein